MSFPELVLATLIVAAGIFALDQFSPASAWMLTILILLIIAFRYQSFASELSKLLSVSSPSGKQDPNFDPTIPDIPLNTINIQSTAP
jgi:hypothetical protein